MKKLFIIVAALAMTFTLAACGTTEEEPTKLVISSSFVREVYEKYEYQVEIFHEFEKEHNVEIELNVYSETGALFDKIDAEQQADNVVTDVLIAHYSDMVNYIDENDYMLDLADLEAEMTDKSFSDAFNGSTNRGDARYFFPINTDVYVSIAHNDAFDHLPAGLTEADVLAGDYTWDQFVAWVDGTNVQTMIKGKSSSLIIYQIGGMALSHTDTIAGTFPGLNSDANKAAWSDVLALQLAGGIHPDSATNNDVSGLLQDGSIQVAFAHMNQVSTAYTNAPAEFKVFPGPKGDSGKAGSIVGGHGVGVVAGSANEELAKKFVDWMTDPDQIVHAALGSVPPLAEAIDALGSTPKDEVIKMGISTIANANVEGLQMIPLYENWTSVKNCSDRVFAAIMDGSITTEEQLFAKLDEEQAALEALLK